VCLLFIDAGSPADIPAPMRSPHDGLNVAALVDCATRDATLLRRSQMMAMNTLKRLLSKTDNTTGWALPTLTPASTVLCQPLPAIGIQWQGQRVNASSGNMAAGQL